MCYFILYTFTAFIDVDFIELNPCLELVRMTSSRCSSHLLLLSVIQEKEIRVKVVQVIKLLVWIKHRRIGTFLVKSDIQCILHVLFLLLMINVEPNVFLFFLIYFT